MLEGQRVDRDVDRALDGVLDGHEAEVELAGVDGRQHLGEGAHGHELLAGQVGLGQQGLLGEGALGAEEADATAAVRVRRRRSRGAMLLTWTKPPCWDCSSRCAPASSTPTTRWPRCGACPFADLGFARVDHHRALRQGMPEAVYGPGKTPEHCAAIVTELLDAGAAPVAGHPGRPTTRPRPPSRPTRTGPRTGTTLVWRPAAPRPERVVVVHRRHRRPAGGRRVRHRPRRPRPRARSASPTPAWPGSTASWPRPTPWPTPTPSSWSPAWRARWPAWSAASPARRSWPCPPASATAPGSRGSPRCSAMLASCAAGLTVVGIDNGYGAACAVLRMPEVAADGDDATRLVPLLLRDRRGHGPRVAGRRRRRPRRGAGAAPAGCRSAAGRSRPSPCCAAGIAATQVHVRTEETSVVRTAAAHHRADRGGPAARPGAAAGARRVRARWPRPRAASTAARRSRSTSTRSAGSTPSSTWSAPAPRSRCSASTRCRAVHGRHRHRHGPRRPRPAAQPGARRGRAAGQRAGPDRGPRRRRRAHHPHRRRPAGRPGRRRSARSRR